MTLWPILIILALPLLACAIAGAIWLHREWRGAMDCFALAFGGVPKETGQTNGDGRAAL